LAFVLVVGALALPGPAVDASSPPTPRDHDFDDVPSSNPFHGDITWLVDEGYATGYADGLYHPTAQVSRQALVAILWRMSGAPAGPFPSPFSDVSQDHPFATAIGWAYSLDVIGGYRDGTFRPGAPVSRQAFGAVLHELSGIQSYYAAMPFTDVSSSHPFAEDIWWWTASGQAKGYPDGTFRPAGAVTRQAAAGRPSSSRRRPTCWRPWKRRSRCASRPSPRRTPPATGTARPVTT
jgi:hypothetical protein